MPRTSAVTRLTGMEETSPWTMAISMEGMENLLVVLEVLEVQGFLRFQDLGVLGFWVFLEFFFRFGGITRGQHKQQQKCSSGC